MNRKEASEIKEELGSIADELKKLVDLRDSGVISESEYQVQKTRLMK